MSSRLVVTGGRFHRYALDGKSVPSVTGITGKALAKPALVGWAAREVAAWAAVHVDEVPVLGEQAWRQHAQGAADRARDAAAEAGRAVHSIAERVISGEPVEAYDPSTGEAYPDDVIRMGEQAARALDAWDITPDTALVERPIYHEVERYAGRFDLCAVVRGGARCVIDYKTGASGVWPESSLQLTGYAHATHVQIERPDGTLLDMKMHPIDRCLVLWLRPDAWEMVPVKSDIPAWNAFRYALRLAAWISQPRESLVGAALPIPSEVA